MTWARTGRGRLVLAFLTAATLGGCAQTATVKEPLAVATPALPTATARERINKAVELLGAGRPEPARAELQAALADEPQNLVARSLLQQIDSDPKVLLGALSYDYRVRPGESLSILADRLLGNRLLFYALARYNGVEAPDAMVAGRILKIPGVAKKVAAPRAVAAAAPPVVVVVAARTRNPGQASKLRGTALEHMNGGKIDRAVSLLRQAQQLDPENALIRRDLDRAMRIQSTVRGRS